MRIQRLFRFEFPVASFVGSIHVQSGFSILHYEAGVELNPAICVKMPPLVVDGNFGVFSCRDVIHYQQHRYSAALVRTVLFVHSLAALLRRVFGVFVVSMTHLLLSLLQSS